MAFLEKSDFALAIYEEILDGVTRNRDELITEATELAEDEIKSYLTARYDVSAIFSQTGSSRHKLVLSLCRDVALYHLCKLCENMTDIRAKAYDDAKATLKEISKQIMNPANLPLIDTAVGGQNYIRYGSKTKRSNSY